MGGPRPATGPLAAEVAPVMSAIKSKMTRDYEIFQQEEATKGLAFPIRAFRPDLIACESKRRKIVATPPVPDMQARLATSG